MWKPDHRDAAKRAGLRFPSDLTDAEWALVAPLIPPAKHGGRNREVNLREVVNAVLSFGTTDGDHGRIEVRRKMAAWSTDYLEAILKGAA